MRHKLDAPDTRDAALQTISGSYAGYQFAGLEVSSLAYRLSGLVPEQLQLATDFGALLGQVDFVPKLVDTGQEVRVPAYDELLPARRREQFFSLAGEQWYIGGQCFWAQVSDRDLTRLDFVPGVPESERGHGGELFSFGGKDAVPSGGQLVDLTLPTGLLLRVDSGRTKLRRVFNPAPGAQNNPTSPVIACLKLLEQLELLTIQIDGQLSQRGSILSLPSSIGKDTYADLVKSLALNRGPAGDASKRLLALMVPAEDLAKIRVTPLAEPLDGLGLQLRRELIMRILISQDAPPKMLTGLQGSAGSGRYGMAEMMREDSRRGRVTACAHQFAAALDSLFLSGRDDVRFRADFSRLPVAPDVKQYLLPAYELGIGSPESLAPALGISDE